MAEKRRNWERDEVMQAIELYCRTPFGKIHERNPEIIALAAEIGRTPGAVGLKLANFAALDPTLNRKGMSSYSKLDEEVWSEFFQSPLVFLDRVERMTAQEFPTTFEKLVERVGAVREGDDVERLVKVRRHQDFFRRTLLVSYDGKCAITGIAQPDLLVASHIVPWAEDVTLRLDPRNGILLNALHDKAFDQHLITFEDDLSMIVAPSLKLEGEARWLFEDRRLTLPNRFRPSPEIMARHRDQFQQKWAL